MSDADPLRAAIEADRPARHQTRLLSYGRRFVDGVVGLPLHVVDTVRTALRKAGRLKDVALLEWALLEQQGYRVVDGELWGPKTWPGGGAPPRPGSVIPVTISGEPAAGGRADLSISEARREVVALDEFDRWSRAVREHVLWRQCQDRRARVIAEVLVDRLGVRKVAVVMRRSLPSGDPALELWSETEIDADYPEP